MTFSELAKYFQRLEATASRNSMTEILSELFHKAKPQEIGEICYLLQGRTVPLYEAVEFGIADKLMIRAIALAYVCDENKVRQLFKKFGDLGKSAEDCYHARPPARQVTEHDNKGYSVHDVFVKLDELARVRGAGSQEKKIGLLADLLSHVDALSSRYIVRIPLDKLRLGFSDMTILDALSWMEVGDKSLRGRLEAVYNVRPDIGLLAAEVKRKGVAGLAHIHAKVGAPILASLCARLPNADEMVKKMGEVAVEPKYDGVRVQIHFKRGMGVSSFSRNLENTSPMFPELNDIGRELAAVEVILDSEAVGYDAQQDRLIPFQETVTRKRKHGITESAKNIPLKFFVFDILYKNGKELLSIPLMERRKILEETLRPPAGGSGHLMLSPQIVTRDANVIRQYHDEQLKKGLEGAVVKKWDSIYEPGRAGYHWVKFKEEEGKTGKLTDTIDAVIMGYYRGEGKRSSFGIGAFLVGVVRGDSIVTVTKIGTGVSDELWKEIRKRLNDIKVSQQPKEYKEVNKLLIPDVWVAPKIVVELAGDDLTRSPTHGAGIAVRFPRLVRIRDDKSPREATTVRELTTMYKNQGSRV
ncbi:MAG: ATP-dependent DNA ligase [Candidatus Gottesmanbacteria bacterium]|nr:ATP-dependent DNA ligase [Candidatus Gottesmanbacteria bacterium]